MRLCGGEGKAWNAAPVVPPKGLGRESEGGAGTHNGHQRLNADRAIYPAETVSFQMGLLRERGVGDTL